MSTKRYTNEIGVVIRLNTGIDLTGATNPIIKVLRPDGSSVTWTATIVSINSSNSYVQYTTQSGDLNLPGLYRVQPFVNFSNWIGPGETASFEVYSPFN
jgi:hypothetical protein